MVLTIAHIVFTFFRYKKIIEYRILNNKRKKNMKTSPINRRSFVKTSALITSGFAAAVMAKDSNAASQSVFLKDLSDTWDRSKECTLNFAKAMPEEDYKFKPTPDIYSYAEQLLHITGSNFGLAARAAGKEPPENNLDAEGKSKDEIISILTKSFAYGAEIIKSISTENSEETVEFFKMKVKRYQLLLLMRDHLTHHRGQMVIYLRLKGIKPPQYAGL